MAKVMTPKPRREEEYSKRLTHYLSRSLTSKYYLAFQPSLLRVLKITRLRFIEKNRFLLIAVQDSLAKMLDSLGGVISRGNEVYKRLNDIPLEKKSKDLIENIKKKKEDCDIRLFQHKNIVRIIKTITDGIAWRNLNFDRAVLRLLAENRSSGPIRLESKGFRGMLKLASSIMHLKKSVVLINDLTNILRIGDFIEIGKWGVFIHESKDKGKTLVNIFSLLKDIKKGHKIGRQSSRIMKAQTAITFKKIYLSEEKEVQIKYINVPYKHYLKEVYHIIKQSKRLGFHSGKISNYLYVSCLDIIKAIEVNRAIPEEKWDKHEMNRGWAESDLTIPFKSLDLFYDSEDSFIPNIAPYSIFPYPANICLELLNGRLLLASYLNISELKRYFEGKGWQVLQVDLEKLMAGSNQEKNEMANYEADETLFTLRKGSFNVQLPAILIFRIAMEFVAAETIANEAEKLYQDAIPHKDELASINNRRERKIWE